MILQKQIVLPTLDFKCNPLCSFVRYGVWACLWAPEDCPSASTFVGSLGGVPAVPALRAVFSVPLRAIVVAKAVT